MWHYRVKPIRPQSHGPGDCSVTKWAFPDWLVKIWLLWSPAVCVENADLSANTHHLLFRQWWNCEKFNTNWWWRPSAFRVKAVPFESCWLQHWGITFTLKVNLLCLVSSICRQVGAFMQTPGDCGSLLATKDPESSLSYTAAGAVPSCTEWPHARHL